MSILKPIELTPAQEAERRTIVLALVETGVHEAISQLIKDRDDARNERDNALRELEAIESAAEDRRMD